MVVVGGVCWHSTTFRLPTTQQQQYAWLPGLPVSRDCAGGSAHRRPAASPSAKPLPTARPWAAAPRPMTRPPPCSAQWLPAAAQRCWLGCGRRRCAAGGREPPGAAWLNYCFAETRCREAQGLRLCCAQWGGRRSCPHSNPARLVGWVIHGHTQRTTRARDATIAASAETGVEGGMGRSPRALWPAQGCRRARRSKWRARGRRRRRENGLPIVASAHGCCTPWQLPFKLPEALQQ